jgi:hypothetical protein
MRQMHLKGITIQEIIDDLSIRKPLGGPTTFPVKLNVKCERLDSGRAYSVRVLGPAERSNPWNTTTVFVDPSFSRSDMVNLGDDYDKEIFEKAI